MLPELPSRALGPIVLLCLAACGEVEDRWPQDPVGMRTRLAERVGLEGGAATALRGDGRHREILSAELADLDAELWPEEIVAGELTSGPLVLLRELLIGREADPARIFAGDARLGPFHQTTGERATLGPLVTRIELEAPDRGDGGADDGPDEGADEGAGERQLATAAWLDDVRGELGELERVRYARATVLELRYGEVEVEARLLVELNGVLPTGGLRHDERIWRTRWRRVDAPPQPDGSPGVPWRCRSLEVEAGHRLESSAPLFVDTTLEALGGTKLDPRQPQYQPNLHIGAALAYIDDDDVIDIAVAQPTRVLLGRGDGTFEDATERMGLQPEYVPVGVIAADFDRDGDTDLAWGAGRNLPSMLHLQEDGRFVARPMEESLSDSLSTSLSAHDVDGDGYLDLFIAGYGSFGNPGPNDPIAADNGRSNQMLRGGPDGTFTDVTEEWGFDEERLRWCFIGAFGDADGDGDVDLYTANDWGPNVLYRRVSDDPVRFRAEVEQAEVIEPGFSMSAFWADLDGDLDLDMYVSNMSSHEADRMAATGGVASDDRISHMRRIMSAGNTLMDNGGEAFAAAADVRGARRAAWAWGTALFDYDLDGDLDVHVVNGFLSKGVDDGRDWDSVWWRHGLRRMAEGPAEWPALYEQFNRCASVGWSWAGFQRAVLFQNDGSASFSDVAPVLGLDQVNDGRGVAMADLDRDGDVDLVGTSNSHPHLYVLRNDGPISGSFLWVDARPADHRAPAGTRIVVTAGERSQRRDVALGSGYLSQHETAQHFGLGDAEVVDTIEVTWPDGSVQRVESVPASARVIVRQGEEGFERVPLKEHNWNATGRVAPIEWDDDPARLRHVRGRVPDLGRFELVDAAGERVPTTGRSQVLIVFETSDPDAGRWVEAARELATWAPDALTAVLVPLGEDSDEARVPLGSPVRVVAMRADQRRELLRTLRPWTGHRGPRYPVILVLNPKGHARAIAEDEVRLDVLQEFLRR